MSPRDVVVAGWTGSSNLGDELLHVGLRRLLADVGVHDPVVVSQDPDATVRAHGGRAVGAAAGLAAAARARLLVWGGGGIVQDETSALNLPWHLARPAAARVAGRPWVGLGLGVGPLVGATATRQVGLLRSATGLTVRDWASARLLAEHGVPGATVACDLALALDPPTPAVDDVVVASLRPWEQQVTGAARLLPVSLRTRLRADDGVDADRARVTHHARVLDAVAAATGLPLRLVALDTVGDAALHARVAEAMDTPVELVVPDVHGLVAAVGSGRVVLGMRYHAGVAATLAGRPVVTLSYSDKTTALAGQLGAGARGVTWDAEPDAVASAAVELLGDAEAPARVVAARDRLRARLDLHRDLLAAGLAAGDRS